MEQDQQDTSIDAVKINCSRINKRLFNVYLILRSQESNG